MMTSNYGVALSAALTASLVFSTVASAQERQVDRSGMAAEQKEDMPAGTLGQGLQIQEQNGISFVSGGVGDEQQDVLDSVAGRFNLKLTLARQDGKFMGSSALRIAKQGGATVLETQTNGPLFLAKLPAGRYSINAAAAGQSYTRTVTVPSSGQKELVLTWPAEANSIGAGDAPAAGARPEP
jgi:hypothetical protein